MTTAAPQPRDADAPALYAVSDVHTAIPANYALTVERIRPTHPGDWLLVAGDVAESPEQVAKTLAVFAERFDTVVWTPGNHELWADAEDGPERRGEARYRLLVERCRELGVLTPEDPFPVWHGADGPLTVAPLFVLYDYTFMPPGAATREEGLAIAREAGVVCTDEYVLDPTPYPSRQAWCEARVAYTEARLAESADPAAPYVLVNHFPLVRTPTDVLWYPEFAQWCGTVRTADWHTRFPTTAVVYGHLHIPRTTWYDGVRFEEVSLGYPRERKSGLRRPVPRRIFPAEESSAAAVQAVAG
ncbi:metallophosphoesterase family protein [Yinghuangia seranimata]|uniref:metallophosphoesterase family protein n=1 Tax=Yinghuangia seranimata TaxID=408067 RepID=UPI00248AEEEE|nr:metallophosphoesterase [Yinghuangia seranimata]MDI2129861.1 metallophosphoesterase [Yinghuangia seranimata]